jgi:hypothetical protein
MQGLVEWRIVAENCWRTVAEKRWLIYVRGLTARAGFGGQSHQMQNPHLPRMLSAGVGGRFPESVGIRLHLSGARGIRPPFHL